MAVDVVIPLFNGGPYIEETLEGVFAQSVELGEVIVVDDGSSDDGCERVRRFGESVRLLACRPDLRPRQTGLLATTGPLVAFVDQDDVWHPDHLASLVAALDAEPAAPAAVSAVMTFLDGDRPAYALRPGELGRIDPWDSWPFGCPIWPPSAVLFRRAPLVEVGAWRREPAPDWQAYLRIARLAPIVSTPSATCAYRLHPGGRPGVRRPDGPSRLERMGHAVVAAYEHRMATEDDEAMCARMRRRRGAYGNFDTFLRALDQRDVSRASVAAQALEQDLVPESDTYLIQLLEHAAYLCRPDDHADEIRRFRRDFLGRIASVLPDGARRTRCAALALAPSSSVRWRRLVRYLLKGRWPSALRVLVKAEQGARGEATDRLSW